MRCGPDDDTLKLDEPCLDEPRLPVDTQQYSATCHVTACPHSPLQLEHGALGSSAGTVPANEATGHGMPRAPSTPCGSPKPRLNSELLVAHLVASPSTGTAPLPPSHSLWPQRFPSAQVQLSHRSQV